MDGSHESKCDQGTERKPDRVCGMLRESGPSHNFVLRLLTSRATEKSGDLQVESIITNREHCKEYKGSLIF